MNKQSENDHAEMLNFHPSTGPQLVNTPPITLPLVICISFIVIPVNVGCAYDN